MLTMPFGGAGMHGACPYCETQFRPLFKWRCSIEKRIVERDALFKKWQWVFLGVTKNCRHPKGTTAM